MADNRMTGVGVSARKLASFYPQPARAIHLQTNEERYAIGAQIRRERGHLDVMKYDFEFAQDVTKCPTILWAAQAHITDNEESPSRLAGAARRVCELADQSITDGALALESVALFEDKTGIIPASVFNSKELKGAPVVNVNGLAQRLTDNQFNPASPIEGRAFYYSFAGKIKPPFESFFMEWQNAPKAGPGEPVTYVSWLDVTPVEKLGEREDWILRQLTSVIADDQMAGIKRVVRSQTFADFGGGAVVGPFQVHLLALDSDDHIVTMRNSFAPIIAKLPTPEDSLSYMTRNFQNNAIPVLSLMRLGQADDLLMKRQSGYEGPTFALNINGFSPVLSRPDAPAFSISL